ncbi:hypothetical protein LCGC14_0975810, partial [marine sediment metagenome]
MTQEKDKHLEVLKRFIETYCSANHGSNDNNLCAECSDLFEYSRTRLEKCPYDPKPKCKDCQTHCYKPEYRKKIKEVMRFSGMHFVKRG